MPMSNEQFAEAEAASKRIAAAEARRIRPTQLITVYVCPRPDCENYFGSSSMTNLSAEWTGHKGMNGERWPDKAHTRAECPDCRERGISTERQKVVFRIELPPEQPRPPVPEEIRTMEPVGSQ